METAARPAHGHDFAWGLWATTCAEPAPACPALQGAAETQVAIIGAGYLGLSTALALAENGVAVTVLEAEAPCIFSS